MIRTPALIAAAALATLLAAGCNRNDERTAGQRVDSAVATAERKTENAAAATERAVEKTGDKVADAAITTSINAELAKDRDLSALRINVDTTDGRVVLRGQAPSAQARDRATQLARGVSGVTAVDNQLEVRS